MSKITRPILTEVLPRKRLFRLLDRMRRRPIIWVSGPAGSGKTTLVSSYIDACRSPCLWYQVDDGDTDPATFFYYMAQAAKRISPRKRNPLPLLTPEYLQGIPTFTLRYFEELYNRLIHPHPPLVKGGKRGRFRKWGDKREPVIYPPLKKGGKGGFVLVFDNYQEVPVESPFHEVILNGLSRIPEGINVILISRSETPPALIQLHANNLMNLVGWDELRLTQEESNALVKLRTQGKLSKETTRHFHKVTDGWAAGIVLMLESIKRGIEPKLLRKLTPEEITDYFATVLFHKTDKKIQEFFLKTAFLPKMTAEMAAELTGLPNAGSVLSSLNRNNYFTEKRFHKEPIYQYHPLFREFLLSRAKETFSPKALKVLLTRAAKLLEEDCQTESTVSLLRDAGDWDEIVRLIMKHAPSMVEQGRNRPLEEWLSSLPKDMIENDPWLLYWMGICCLPFDPSRSRHYFEKAFERFMTQGEVTGITLACWGIVHSIIYGMADFKPLDRWIPVLEELGHSFKEFPSDETELRFTSAMFSALVYRRPQHPEIEIWGERALSLAEGSSNLNLKLQTISTVAIYRVNMGDFGKALLVINSLRKLSQSRDATPLIRIRLGFIEAAYYRYVGLYEKCLKAVTDGLELSRTTGIHMFEIALLYHGISSAVSASDHTTAVRLLEEMAPSLRSFRPWDLCMYHSAKTQEALFRGDPGQASLHIEQAMKLRMEAGFTFLTGWCHIQNAHVMHELGRHREAAEHLTHAFDFAREVRGKNTEYAVLLARALFAFDLGKEEAGLFSLRKAFALGRERGYFGTWGPKPSAMAKLCTKALEAGVEVEYVQELIRRLNVIPEQPPLHLENWPWPLKIFTLGPFELIKDGKPIQFSRKVQQRPLAMIKAFVAFGGKEVREEQIADVLWPEADGDDAHHSFVTNLHRLRQLIGHDKTIQLREGKLTLDSRHCWVDVWAFEQILRQAEDGQESGVADNGIRLIEKALELYKGHFLAGEIEQPWMISLREHLRSRFLRGVTWLGHYWEKTEQWEKALQCYHRGLEVDDVAEELYQHLMACFQRLGRRNEALSVYNRLKRTLSAVLGVDPSPKTQAIYRSLLS